MECSIHNVPMFQGTSKTKFNDDGTPKTYFYHKVGSDMCFGDNKKDKAPYTPKMAEKATEIREKVAEQPDWDAIARGKVRNSVAVAFIGQGIKVPGDDVIDAMEKWVNYIMNGVKEQG